MTISIHTKEYRELIELIIKARKESGLTQVEVAEKLGRPQSHISNIESGQHKVDVIELKQLAKIYKKDISYFF